MSAPIEAASENLRVQAEKLMRLAAANDKSAVEAQVGNLFSSCGAVTNNLETNISIIEGSWLSALSVSSLY